MQIIEYDEQYVREIAELFHNTTRAIASKDYTDQEINAWAGKTIDYDKWQNRLKLKHPFLAIKDSHVVGFAELEKDGHKDCFYVHKDYQKQSIEKSLMKKIKIEAKKNKIQKLFAEVSITAKPFFLAAGFQTIRSNIAIKGNQKLRNYIMELKL